MRVELEKKGPAHAYVIVGDGGRDIRILRAAAEKYDHGKMLRLPQTPFKGETGVQGMARQLIHLIDYTRMDKYLALIDKEHVENINELNRKLEEHGLNILHEEQLVEGCLKLKLSRGDKRATVYLSILGWVKAVEENLAKLIEKLHGKHIEASKEAIKSGLKINA